MEVREYFGRYEAFADVEEFFVEFKVREIGAQDNYLTGFVKWDGCSNWSFDEQEYCMLHFCSRKELLQLGVLMANLMDWASEILPTWGAFAAAD